WPSQSAHPFGGKPKETILISDKNGVAMRLFSFPFYKVASLPDLLTGASVLSARRENSLQGYTEIEHQERLQVVVRSASAGNPHRYGGHLIIRGRRVFVVAPGICGPIIFRGAILVAHARVALCCVGVRRNLRHKQRHPRLASGLA